jgi:hypothetical protein
MSRTRLDLSNRDVEVAAHKAGQQGQEGQMRRKPQGLEDVVNDADLNKCEDNGKPKKEQNSVQKEKWAEKHGRHDTTLPGQRHGLNKICRP